MRLYLNAQNPMRATSSTTLLLLALLPPTLADFYGNSDEKNWHPPKVHPPTERPDVYHLLVCQQCQDIYHGFKSTERPTPGTLGTRGRAQTHFTKKCFDAAKQACDHDPTIKGSDSHSHPRGLQRVLKHFPFCRKTGEKFWEQLQDVPEYAIQVISDWKDDPEGPCNQPGFVPENLKEKTEL